MKYISFETLFKPRGKSLRNAQEQPLLRQLYIQNIFKTYSNLLWYNLSKIYAKFRTKAEHSPVQDKLSEHSGGI